MSRPRLLDLFCGAGGAAMGYHRAGFDVTGVDVKPQPHYPFDFIQADTIEYMRSKPSDVVQFDVIHASPPCQAFTVARPIRAGDHPDLVTPTRDLVSGFGRPWVIENVPGAPMRADLMLCGSMFGLEVQRHRWFEFSDPYLRLSPPCRHIWEGGRPVGVYGHTGGKATGITSGNHGWVVADWRRAMGIDWMTRDELKDAIPPDYTELIGTQLLRSLAVAA